MCQAAGRRKKGDSVQVVGRPLPRVKVLCALLASCLAAGAFANPTGPSVVSGSAAFSSAGGALTVSNSPNAIINWQGFSIGAGEITRFQQQSAASAVLNRVVGQDPSAILGTLWSNGRVFLVNPNGIVFGQGSRVDAAAFGASTLNISDADFLGGRLNFQAGAIAKPIVNQGELQSATGGYIYLVSPDITNSGLISSPQGAVVLAAGRTVSLADIGTPNLKVEVSAPEATVRNLGQIVADSGRIGVYAGLIHQQGSVQANSASRDAAGRIVLRASDTALLEQGSVTSANGPAGGAISIGGDVVINTGRVEASGAAGGSIAVAARNYLGAGTLRADGEAGNGGEVSVNATGRIIQTSAEQVSAKGTQQGGSIVINAGERIFSSATLDASGGRGGEVSMLAPEILLLAATIDASGASGGGTVLIGGDYHGANPAVPNANTNWINSFTTIRADAKDSGDGGRVIVWSDRETQFYGSISARGGAQSGNGGLIEVSGKEKLVFGGTADAGAPNGAAGMLLLDPKNIVIDAAASGGGNAMLLADPNPNAGDGTGMSVTVLKNDNIVVAQPNDDFAAANAGAVYLYSGTTGALIATLTGSQASDGVGSGGVTALTNGNYVVSTPSWSNGGAARAGAATFGNGSTGISGAVSAANSLVGSIADDRVAEPSTTPGAEHPGVVALTNGNYVVISHRWTNGAQSFAGAATWGDGTTGIVGPVSAANSLVGTTSLDRVGSHGATALANGNYVVRSALWTNGGAARAGAATFGDGTTGITGAVTTANSLVGSATDDNVGGGVYALTNGNYVVNSPNWANGGAASAGAVTWANGTNGFTVGAVSAGAVVSAANSLVGTSAGDFVGAASADPLIPALGVPQKPGVTALTNGNYVVASPSWNGSRGAATWGDGTAGVVGDVSAANSLVGSTANDFVGISVTALTNGNYVVRSPGWTDGGATPEAGAATWGNGATGIIGAVSNANSLVGSINGDRVGANDVIALTNGNYLVLSPVWGAFNTGAATLGSGTAGTPVGVISAANSLVGDTNFDRIGVFARALPGGAYVVSSQFWNGDRGAVTWSSAAGRVGTVDVSNSLVGSNAGDFVGSDITVLNNGNYVVSSPFWANGGAAQAGAVTFANGTTGITGAVSAGNSLVGTTASDSVGSGGVFPLAGGNYVVSSPVWNNGGTASAGAVTWGNGTAGISGAVSAANSLVGTVANDQIGSGGISGLSNGNYVVSSPVADSGGLADAGLVHLVSPGSLSFSLNPAGSVTISPASITAVTNTGTAVTLQANNDITLNVSSPIITSAGGTGGAITMQAGRSILLNSSITTDNGPITLIANERVANGVVDAQRDPGSAVITMATGTTINAGNAPMFIWVNDGLGLTNSARGDITVANLATTGVVQLIGLGSGIRQQANSVITAGTLYADSPGSVVLDNFPSGTGHLVGTLAGTTFSDFNFKNGQSLTIGACGCGPSGIRASGNVNLSVSGGVTFNANVTKFISGGGSTLQVTAANDIIVAGGVSISGADTANPLNIVFAPGATLSPGGIMIGDGVTTSTIDTKGGNITLGPSGPQPGGTVATGGNGLWLNKATVNAGAGTIDIHRLGQLGVATSYGVLLSTGAVLQTTTGNIQIEGYGGQFSPGGGVNAGAKLIDTGTKITTAGGSINITGVGGTGGPEQSLGIWVANGAVIEATGSGSVLLGGTGGVAAGGNNHGLLIDGAGTRVSTAGGALTVFGTASGYNGFGAPTPTTGGPNVGIFLDNGALVETTGAGAISLTGSSVGSTDAGSNRGILVQGVGTTVQSANGTVTLTGTGGNTTGALGGGLSSFNDGVRVSSGAAVESTGTGSILMTGTGGTSLDGGQNNGIALSAGRVQSASGAITLTGTGKGAGANNAGVFLDSSSQIISTGVTTITGTGSIDPAATNSRGIDLNSGSISSTVSPLALNGTGGTGSSGVATAAGTSLAGGTISVQATSDLSVGGSVSATNSATLTADDMDITGTVSAANSVTLSPLTASQNIAIATGGCGSLLCIGPSEIQNVTAPTLTIGRSDGTGSLSVNEALAASNINTSNLLLRAGTVNFNAGVATPNSGGARTLQVEARQDIMVGGVSISAADTANPLSIVFLPNKAGAGGAILLNPGSTLDTKGGDVTLGHSTLGPAVGTAATLGTGVYIWGTVNAGAGNITIAGTGQSASTEQASGIVLQSGLLQTTSGSITLNGGGGDSTNPALSKAGVTIFGDAISTVDGTIQITGSGSLSSATVGSSWGVLIQNGIVEATGAGSIAITGTGGAAPGGNNTGLAMAGTTNRISANSGGISIIGNGGTTGTISGISARGQITSSTGTIAMTSPGPSGEIILFGSPGDVFSTGGAVTLSANSITSGGIPIIVGGLTTLSGGTISLTSAANDFNTVSVNAAGGVTLTDINALVLGTISASSLNVTAGGAITQSGAATVSGASSFAAGANPITLTNAGNDFGAVTLTGSSASITDANSLVLGTVSLGSGSLAVSASGAITQSGPITAGLATFNAGANPITLTNAGNDFSGAVALTGTSVSITDANALTLGAVNVSSLNVTAGGAITQSAPLTVIGTSSFAAGANPITLANAGNDFGGAVSLGGGAVSITDTNALTLGLVNASSLTANGTSITQDASGVTVSGTATLNAGSIFLISATNNFATVVATSGGLVALQDANAIALGATNAGSLQVTAGGAITQTGPITAGSSSFFAGANPITLTNAGNDFTGPVTLGGGAVAITDANALTLSGVNASSLTVNAASITQDASGVVVSGTSTLSAGSITLTSATNDFGTVSAASAGSVFLTDANALILGTTSASSLTVTAGGAITQSGAAAVSGTSSFAAGANPITLTNASNDFGGAVSLTGGIVAITDVNAISFGASSAGSLTVNAGGAITQTAPITTGAASFNAGANPITLMGAGNDFTGAVTLTGSSASITDANALLLGTVSLGSGSLAVSAFGAITQSGPITAGPATFFTLPASPITLTNAGNDFSGAVSLTGGAVSLTDANALDLGLANVSSLNVTAGGAITQSAPLSVSGTATFAAGSNAITLANAGNDFGGAVSLGGGVVSITDTNALILGLVNTSSLTANAASITQDASGVVVSGTSTLNAGSIALALGTNDFGTVVATSAGPVALADVNSITLGATSASSLSVSAFGGSITQSGPITAGSSSFFAGASPITLTNAGNDFTGPVTLGGGIVAITDANAVTLSGVNASSLTVNAASITQDASGIAVSGTSTLSAGSITLTSATNDFGTVSAASAGNVSLTDTNALVLGTTSASSLNVTAGGAITQSGAATVSGTSTFAAGTNPVTLTNASNDFGGTVTLTGGAVSITDANALTLGAVNASSLTVNATSLTQDASGVVVSGTSTLNAGSVTLTAATNDFGTVAATSAVNVSLTDANAIALGSVNATSLNVTAGGAITQSGAATVSGASSFAAGANPITLTNAGNDFTGAVSLTGGAVSLTDANALDLGSVNVSSLNVVSGGAITQSAPLSVSGTATFAAGANAITLANVANDFGGPVSLGGGPVSITDANALTLGLVNTSSLTVNAGSVAQNASGVAVSGTTTLNAGSIALTTATNDFGTLAATSGGSVAVTDANAISLGAINSASLNVTAGGAITQSAPLSIGGASTFAAGANPITLTNAANDFTGAVSLTGSTVAITDANSLTLGTLSTGDLTAVSTGPLNLGQGAVGGSLVATSNGGAITQSGPLAVTGNSTLSAGVGSITLGNAGNDFTGALSLTGSSAAITDANALVLGSVSLGGGSLTVNTSGAITQSGPITAGAESFSAGANPITLTNAGNDFTGAVSLTGGAVSLTDANALDLGSVNVSSLNVVSGGAITQSAPLSVSGTATFAAGANAITLANVTNDFGGPVSLGGGAVALTDANALTLGLVNASSLTVNATSITQDASGLSVSGTTTLNAGSIALTTATNVFGTLVTTSGGSVSVTDANAVSLGAINAASLNVTAGGAITQSAPVTVSGASAFAAGANPITLTNASNDFTGAVNLTGSSAAITDANALALGTVSLGGGSLTANASGAITQTGPITAGASSFSAGANPITLTNAGNDFTGAVSLTGGAVSLTIANALDLGLVNVSSLNVVAGGAITQSGPIAAGTTSLGAGSNAITLPNATNDFTGAVSLTGGAVSITDANALTLGTLATGALTAVSTGALNLGQGAVGGNLVATSNGGAITQSGGLTVAGTSSLDAGASSITLANAGNDFGGAVSLSGSSASIADANALTLGTVSLGGGSLVVTASGAITQSGSITAGAASFNAGSNPITLANPGNDFSGAVSLSGGDVTITDANVLTLGAVNASSLTANCASFNQDGSGIVVTGPSTLTAGQITLNSATNAFDTVNVAGTLDASTGTLTAVTWNLLSGGTLKGAGTVTGNVNNSGTISPGASPGTLTINGNFVQASGGVLNMEIAGLTPGTQHDQLIVNGNATLGGTLNATPIGGFSLAPGDSFALVRSSGVITGTFGVIAQPGGVLLNGIYGPASFDLIVSTGSVPLAVQPSLNYAVATTQPASTPTTTQSSPVTTTTTISEGENAASTSDPGAATEEKKIVGRPLRCKS